MNKNITILFLIPFLWIPAQALPDAAVLQALDSGDVAEALRLVEKIRTEAPDRFDSLPYALLRARLLEETGDVQNAVSAYHQLASDADMARYALLPLARLEASRGNNDETIRSYQSYLRNQRYPNYSAVALEALDFCLNKQMAEALHETARIVQSNSATHRTGQYYMAKSYLMKGEDAMARSLFLTLIQGAKADDISSRALTELDRLDGNELDEREKAFRGKLAYGVWNFDVAVKYLEPLAYKDMENAYYYARSLFSQGAFKEAKKIYQAALGLWPEHKMARLCLYQYANACLRDGDYERAEELFTKLRSVGGREMLESATFKAVHALRSQSRLDDALRMIEPFCKSRSTSQRAKAIFVRGRIYFQAGKYRSALTDFQQLANGKSFAVNHREVLFWKAITLEKLGQDKDATGIFRTLAADQDFLAFLAAERISVSGPPPTKEKFRVQQVRLPESVDEERVQKMFESGDMLPALLYLRLFEPAALQLSGISDESWSVLGINPKDRLQRYLAVAELAGLGRNYSTATYYSELFLKNLPRNASAFSLPDEVLKVLFPLPYKEEVEKFSQERGLDPLLVLSIMKQESKFKQFAKSPAFARGLMQIIPPTAVKLASAVGLTDFSLEQLYNPEININLGTKFLQDMVDRYGNRLEIIAAGYNSGEANVNRWLASTTTAEPIEFFSNIDLPETRNYVMLVKTNYEWYRRIYGNTEADSTSR